jgi:SMODS-associated and fused to various effectors sensor domain
MTETNPTGRSFLSYRRKRKEEARLLIQAQHDLGIPTWQDVKNLDEVHTEEELKRVLDDPTTANAILWITPEVTESAVIRKIEVPGILARIQRRDRFFVIPVAAGGLDYKAAAEAVDQQISAQDLEHWNLRSVAGDPIAEPEAFEIAKRVLQRRIATAHQALPKNEALQLVLNTRASPAFEPGVVLSLDWTGRFNGREATPETWNQHLLPALKSIAAVLLAHAPGRRIQAKGLPAIAAATALGSAFLTPMGLQISWQQITAGRSSQIWSLENPRESSGFKSQITGADVNGNDLAILVSVAGNVEGAFAASKKDLSRFRAITTVSKAGQTPHDILTPGQAVDVAYVVVEGIRRAREEYRQSIQFISLWQYLLVWQ